MLPRRHEQVALAAALLLHAVALVALRAALGDLPAVSPNAPRIPEAALGIDIELTEPAVPEPFAGAVARRDERAVRSAARGVARIETSGGLEPSAEPSSEVPLDTPPEPVPSEGDGQNTRLDLGIGPDGWQRWVKPPKAGERAPVPRAGARSNRFQVYRAPPVSTTGGLQEGLEEHDRSLGLGPSGRVMTAMHQAAHQTVAPHVGVARFDVTVLQSGAVEVTLGGASGQVEAWRKVAKHIADELRASPPRVKPPRKGVRMVVELVAEETMPNGTKVTELKGLHLDVTPPKLQSTERSVEDLDKDNPTTTDPNPNALPPIKLDLPGIYVAERGKVCSYRLGVSVFGPVFQGGCDPSHIGAKPQRMVRARVLEQTMF